MRASLVMQWRAAAGLMSGSGLASLIAAAPALAQTDFVTDGEAGFVVSHIEYVLSKDAGETGACPDGMSKHLGEIFALTPEGQRREGETDEDYGLRAREAYRTLSTGPNGENLCLNPEVAQDPHFRIVTGENVPVSGGLDLDGRDSRADGESAPGACAHDDFTTFDGKRGIDNQFFRVIGCTHSYQPTGPANGFTNEMLTGAWGILITLSGVDDIENDDEVEVGFYANADPIQLSPSREPLVFATYAVDQNPRYHAIARGRIVDGVLTTEPVDMRFHMTINAMYLERPIDDARVQLTLSPDGVLEGYLAGYTNVEELYDFTFGYRNGKTATGELARQRAGSAGGRARTLGYTCQGVYHALVENADGHPDPETGRCTSVSIQYKIKAIPAFVVDTETQSINADLN